MEPNSKIAVKTNSETDIYIADNYHGLSDLLKDQFDYLPKVLIISDSNVYNLYAEEVKKEIEFLKLPVFEFVFEAGEKSKCLSTAEECFHILLKNDFKKSDLIIALGGGVVTDISGFVASNYKRGINIISLPTTLLCMCDASLGGKCGIDFDSYKNSIGSYCFPSFVYMATDTLSTLSDREFSSGIAEVLKAGLIRDAVFYEWMIMNFSEIMDKEPSFLKEMIYKSVSIKQYFVTKDPFDKNERRMLNFGHTIGHALEEYFNFKYSHGECVALGIISASYIAYKRQLLSMEEFYEIRDMFVPFNLPISLDSFDVDAVYSIIGNDKKIDKCGLNFVLLKKIGKSVTATDVSEAEIKEAIKELIVEWD